ncbi:MAG: BBP7 family outer membrane beta-barrel protein [Planctomycetales bacterium]|nr:BBP7 family outer membrane beta-barrel protein [Planctomycetales bacterium]
MSLRELQNYVTRHVNFTALANVCVPLAMLRQAVAHAWVRLAMPVQLRELRSDAKPKWSLSTNPFILTLLAAIWLLNVHSSNASQEFVECSEAVFYQPTEQLWVQADYLLWWARAAETPALVTTSPNGTPREEAGVLGFANTRVLLGGSLADEVRSGVRIRTGLWTECDQSRGLEFDFLMLERQSVFYSNTTSGNPIVARPFLDANTNQQVAELVGFTGAASGTINAEVRSDGLWGFGANFRRLLRACETCEYGYERLDFLAGYRNANLSDLIRIREDLESPLFGAGAGILTTDEFSTRNLFHGANLGLRYEKRKNNFNLNAFANVALGVTESRVAIDGSTRITSNAFAPINHDGGLLALTTNMGRLSESAFTALADCGVNAGLRLRQNFALNVGYTFLIWPNVMRAGNQIDTAVNPDLLPPAIPNSTGPNRPGRSEVKQDFWAQGINLGFEYRY